MAKLYPERLPHDVTNDPKRSAECKAYRALAQLPAPFVVFYNVAWQVRDVKSGAQDGEADFVVAHPDLGVMILEVKGGQVRYDANLGQWFSTDRDGIEHEIKDPIGQARNSKYALLTKLNELREWDKRFLTIAYMAVFPDVVADKNVSRPDLPRQLVVDQLDLACLEAKIRQGFEWFVGEDERRGALGIERLRTVESLFGRSFALRTPLGAELAEEDQRLIELTENQLGMLRWIQNHRQALIEGCAGSGKTMLAREKARQLAMQGFEVLLVCFNAPLANYLRRCAPEGVKVTHFHGLCRELSEQANLTLPPYSSEKEYFDRVLPEMLLKAASELGPQYDAVIVDEGQDFLEHWWEPLLFLLRDDQQGIFYVFYDSNQNIYQRPSHLTQLIHTPPFTLYENCRNTQAIHGVVKRFHHAPADLECHGPPGRMPELFFYTDVPEQERLVQKVLHRLINEEGVEPSQVVLLTTAAAHKTTFCSGKQLGNFQLVDLDCQEVPRLGIRVSSVHRFKGLESRVVILTGLEKNNPEWLNPLLYVACSRARTHLIVVADERSRAQIEQRFHKA